LISGGICTASDICKIIKACKDSNVATFSFNGLELSFNRGMSGMEETSSQPVIVAQAEEMGDNITEYLDEKNEAEKFAHDMEEMKIVDPLGYEKFLREEDVNHA
jgi:hypothetical protein